MSVTKSDIMSLSFSSINSKIFYAFGVDSQVFDEGVCGCSPDVYVAHRWAVGGGRRLVKRCAKAVQEEVPLTVSTGGHKGTHVVTGGSLRKVCEWRAGCLEDWGETILQVFEFRAAGRWIAAQKVDDEDVFWGVCDQQVLYSSARFDVSSGISRKRKIEVEDGED
eukprot:749892-Hanusia_phi.AAC.3